MSKKDLSLPKGKKVKRPVRDPDLLSGRGIPYWFSPEWVRDLNGTMCRIAPIKVKGGVDLHMLSKGGKLSYIQGSIQKQFHDWHQDQQIDCILLGIDEDDIIATNWDLE